MHFPSLLEKNIGNILLKFKIPHTIFFIIHILLSHSKIHSTKLFTNVRLLGKE